LSARLQIQGAQKIAKLVVVAQFPGVVLEGQVEKIDV
jgi:hypothetical protein